MTDCNSCKTNKPDSVSYVVHESTVARMERQIKRLWITILVLIFLLVGMLWYESQFETIEESYQEVIQEADNGENHFVGGDIIGETDNQDQNN